MDFTKVDFANRIGWATEAVNNYKTVLVDFSQYKDNLNEEISEGFQKINQKLLDF